MFGLVLVGEENSEYIKPIFKYGSEVWAQEAGAT
jgi:hypothetical protein